MSRDSIINKFPFPIIYLSFPDLLDKMWEKNRCKVGKYLRLRNIHRNTSLFLMATKKYKLAKDHRHSDLFPNITDSIR